MAVLLSIINILSELHLYPIALSIKKLVMKAGRPQFNPHQPYMKNQPQKCVFVIWAGELGLAKTGDVWASLARQPS